MRSSVILTGVLLAALAAVSCGERSSNKPAASGTAAVPAASGGGETSTPPNSPGNSSVGSMLGPGLEGQEYRLVQAGIKFIVPKDFKISKDGADTVLLTPDEAVNIRFTVLKDSDFQKAVSGGGKELEQYLKDVRREGSPGARELDGMEGSVIAGTAKDTKGHPLSFELTILNTPQDPLLMNVYGDLSGLEKNAEIVKAFRDTIKKI